MSVLLSKIQSPAKQEVTPEVKAEATKTITIPINFEVGGKVVTFEELETIVKNMGSFDSGYGAPKDKLPPPAAASDKKPYQVPGVKDEEKPDSDKKEETDTDKKEGNFDDKYVSPRVEKEDSEKKEGNYGDHYVDPKSEAKDKGDGSEKPKDTDTDDDDDEDEDSKMKKSAKKDKEEDTEKVTPKKAEFALDFGLAGQVFKPTKAELEAAKNTHFDKNAAFGSTKKKINTIGHQMTAWAISETSRLTAKKS
jgi:hypothetical protein